MNAPVTSRRYNMICVAALAVGVASMACLVIALIQSLKVLFVIALSGIVATLMLGIWGSLAVRRTGERGQSAANHSLALTLLACFLLFHFPFFSDIRHAAAAANSWNNLKQLAGAMRDYNDKHDTLPPAAIRSEDGRPLLSWRVAILPQLGHGELYRRFNLDEPWDSPHNMQLLAEMPAVFRSTGPNYGGKAETYYQVLVGPGTAFERDGLNIPRDFPDGTSHTLLIVEGACPVPWTKPEDVAFGDAPSFPKLAGRTRGTRLYFESWHYASCVVFADGSVAKILADTPEEHIRARATRNGGEITPER